MTTRTLTVAVALAAMALRPTSATAQEDSGVATRTWATLGGGYGAVSTASGAELSGATLNAHLSFMRDLHANAGEGRFFSGGAFVRAGLAEVTPDHTAGDGLTAASLVVGPSIAFGGPNGMLRLHVGWSAVELSADGGYESWSGSGAYLGLDWTYEWFTLFIGEHYVGDVSVGELGLGVSF